MIISTSEARDLIEQTFADFTSDMDYLFNDLSADGYNYLLQQCLELAAIYELPARGKLAGATVEKRTAPLVSQGGGYRAILAQSSDPPWQHPLAVQNSQIPLTPEDEMDYLKRRYAEAVRAGEGREKERIAADLRGKFSLGSLGNR